MKLIREERVEITYLRHSAQLNRVAPFLRFFAGPSPPRASILLSYGGGGGIMEGRGRRWEGSCCLDLSRVHLNIAQVAVLPLYPRIVILLRPSYSVDLQGICQTSLNTTIYGRTDPTLKFPHFYVVTGSSRAVISVELAYQRCLCLCSNIKCAFKFALHSLS